MNPETKQVPTHRHTLHDGAPNLHGRTIAFVVTEDWYFRSHRLPIARAALSAGARVVVATRCNNGGRSLREEGFEVYPIDFHRAGLDPRTDLRTLKAIRRIYEMEQPDIVHHVALKPIVLGSLAAWFCKVPNVVNALAGLGFVFTQSSPRARTLGFLVGLCFRAISWRRGVHFLVQNADDREALAALGIQQHQLSIIRGSGVDTAAYQPQRRRSDGQVVCLFVGRLLWDKGLGELAGAARALKSSHPSVTVRLAGNFDENPASISEEQLNRWIAEDLFDYRGHSDMIADEWAGADIAVLPSYREGLPKALLEAASCGLPLVATDVPGCREICIHETSGLLVPPKNAEALAAMIARLADDEALRHRLGQNGRELVEQHFSDQHVIQQTMQLYCSLLADTAPSARRNALNGTTHPVH